MDRSVIVKRELARFIKEQREKKGLVGDAKIAGYTWEELEENASEMGAGELFAIFEEFFEPADASRFWMELDMALYQTKKEPHQ